MTPGARIEDQHGVAIPLLRCQPAMRASSLKGLQGHTEMAAESV